MSNTLLTSGIILNDLLVRFQNNCAFARTVDTQYKDQFGKPNTVYGKIGESLKVRKPVKYLARTGNSMSTQATTEEYVTINCSTMKGVDFSFTDEELTMSVDEFGERYLESAAVTLASAVDADGLALALNVANSVGVPGTSPGDGTASTDPFADAAGVGTLLKTGALLSEFTAPLSERYVAVSPYTQATLVKSMTNLYNPQSTIGDQFVKGAIGSGLGFEYLADQNVKRLTVGSRAVSGELTVSAVAADGATVSLTGSSSATKTIKAGEVFTLSDVYAVNPVTKVNTGKLQQFTVTADATCAGSTGNVTLSIYPHIIPQGSPASPLQNVSNAPATNGSSAVVFWGAANGTYSQNIAFNKNAFTFVTADLVMPGGVDFSARQSLDNVSMRIVRQFQISDGSLPCRIDVFYGWTTLLPEFACRVWGA